jgi:hypothetical protein
VTDDLALQRIRNNNNAAARKRQQPEGADRAAGDAKAAATGVRKFAEGTAGLPGDAGGMLQSATEYLGSQAQRIPIIGEHISPEAVKTAGAIAKAGGEGLNPLGRIATVLQQMGIIGDQTKAVMNPTSADIHALTTKALPANVNEATSHVPVNTEEKAFDLTGQFVPGLFTGTSELQAAKGAGAFGKALLTRLATRVAAPEAASLGTSAITDKLVKDGRITPETATAFNVLATTAAGVPAAGVERAASAKAAAGTVASTPTAVREVYKALRDNGLDHATASAKLKDMGIADTMLVDLSPGMQQVGRQAGSSFGPGRTQMVKALEDRQTREPGKITAAVEEATGAPPNKFDVASQIQADKNAVGSQYPGTYNQQHTPADTQHIVDDINTELGSVKAKGIRSTLNSIKDTLYIQDQYGKAMPNLDTSSKGLHNARKALDTLMEGMDNPMSANYSPTKKGTLEHYRRLIDNEIARVNPAMKAVDTAFKKEADQAKAFELGHDTLKSSLNKSEFQQKLGELPPETRSRVVEGVAHDMNLKLGATPNERAALRSYLGGETSEANLAAVIGPDKTAALLKELDNIDVKNKSYQTIVKNPVVADTARHQPGVTKGALGAGVTAGVVTGSPTIALGAAATRTATNFLKEKLGGMSREDRTHRLRNEIAKLLSSPDPESVLKASDMMSTIDRKSALPSHMLNALVARRSGGPR